MKKRVIISYIHLLGCIVWLIFGFGGLIAKDSEFSLLMLLAVVVPTASGIYLFAVGRKRLSGKLENIATHRATLKTKIISTIHLIGCIGWSVFAFVILKPEPESNRLKLFDYRESILLSLAILAPTASGVYLYPGIQNLVAQLLKIKKVTILWIGIVIIITMCLFPPVKKEEYYGFLFSPVSIDLSRLFIQCAIVGLITVGLLYTLKDKKD